MPSFWDLSETSWECLDYLSKRRIQNEEFQYLIYQQDEIFGTSHKTQTSVSPMT